MVSNGDSKALSAVEDAYGDHCKVTKLDCVGHVQKRMRKHLLNLKARTKGKLADVKPIGGRGRLSGEKIKQNQRVTIQNQNECINSLVWVWCPKHKHYGVKVIRCAGASAVLHCHGRATSREKVMERLSIAVEKFISKATAEVRPSRHQKSEETSSIGTAETNSKREGSARGRVSPMKLVPSQLLLFNLQLYLVKS